MLNHDKTHVSKYNFDELSGAVKTRLFTVSYFSVGFPTLVGLDRTPAILVCKDERNLRRVSKLPRGALVRVRCRLRSPLQTKMAGRGGGGGTIDAYECRKSHRKNRGL